MSYININNNNNNNNNINMNDKDPIKKLKSRLYFGRGSHGETINSSSLLLSPKPKKPKEITNEERMLLKSSLRVKKAIKQSYSGTVEVPDSLQPLLGSNLYGISLQQGDNNNNLSQDKLNQSNDMIDESSNEFNKQDNNQLTIYDNTNLNNDNTKNNLNNNRNAFDFIKKINANPDTEEFVYLNPIGPYDLRIVKHDQINTNHYYTMSRAGVTHFYQQETDFTTLEQWTREYDLFTRMMKIKFFAKFRVWKAFYFWNRHIRRQKIQKCKKYLQANLCILNPNLRDALMQLRSLCCDISKWSLFKIEPNQTVTLNEFKRIQNDHQVDVAKLLDDIQLRVREIVVHVCDIDLRDFLVKNGFRKTTEELVNTNVSSPTKVSHAEKAAIRTKCRKLTKFIQLADFLLIDTLVTLALDRTNDLWNDMQRPLIVENIQNCIAPIIDDDDEDDEFEQIGVLSDVRDENKKVIKNPIIVISATANIDPNDYVENVRERLSLTPALNEIHECFEHIIMQAVRGIMSVDRLIDDDVTFNDYTRVGLEDGEKEESLEFELHMLVLQHSSLQNSVSGVAKCLENAYNAATEYSFTFQPYLSIYLENEVTNMDDYKSSTLKGFSNLITKYETQVIEFENMAISANIGILKVDSLDLKENFLPSPQRCLLETQALLPNVAHTKTKKLYDELVIANDKISALPDSVEHFVEILQFLHQVTSTMEDTEMSFSFIDELWQLIQQHNITITNEQKISFDQLKQQLVTFKMSIQFCEASIDANTERFSRELAKDIPVLQQNIKDIVSDLQHDMITDPNSDMDETVTFLEERERRLKDLEETAKKYQFYQEILEVDIVEYPDLETTRKDMNVKLELWTSLRQWNDMQKDWNNTTVDELDLDATNKLVTTYSKRCAKARTLLDDNLVVQKLRQQINNVRQMQPVVQDLRSTNLRKHHWDELRNILKIDIYKLKEENKLTIGILNEVNAQKHRGLIADVAMRAGQEASLRSMLDKVEDVWMKTDLPINMYKGHKDVYVLSNLEDVITNLDESMVTINTIMGSRYVECIREDVTNWRNRLVLMQETLDEWVTVQRSWMYLEAIFTSQDIIRQLPEEASIFNRVDKQWKEIMQRANDSPNALESCLYSNLKETFQQQNATLERVQKRLEQYLETKRMSFPRFYFLSNDELLEILAHSKDIRAVQSHLRKCFDNIVRLELKDKDIMAMLSAEGERVPLGRNNRHTQARNSVEIWLSALEQDMQNSLKRFMKKGVIAYDQMSRKDWIMNSFSQIVMTVSQIMWSRMCENAILDKNSKKKLIECYNVQLQQLSELTALVRGELDKAERKKIVALVTTDVHGRDVMQKLIDENVSNLNNFLWQQQLRFYWDIDEDDCIIRQSNALFNYGYEYMGITSRLVITPLTDRCWMTITGALHLRYGASPAGPAGTGKTESTKDLAKAMGIMCVVYNCSDQIDYHMMAKLFSGLAQTGAWTCLDEFNRIDIEVLSVVAQQLLQVRQALLSNSTEFVFQGVHMTLKSTFGCMITMNPGYAGRTELPDNLKVLFRPVAMMIPDYALIAEIMLFAEGFDSASKLAKKMVQLYKLASEQLSQQDHYDFGMRAVKSVLVMAGSLKRAQPHLDEEVVLIRAMRDSNVPKFLADDLPLFDAIVQDLFPSVDIPDNTEAELSMAIESTIDEMGLQYLDEFAEKVMQLYITFNVRFGVMLVGPTGAGKSQCYKVLAQTMTKLRERGSTNEDFQTVHTHILNPKCVSMGELYGEMDPLTQEWTDGLASSIMRDAMRDRSDDRHWVVFDGPVDALWIENMNTVLDDNMTLCLSNGERLKLKSELRMLFEVQDLAVASPATVSRCGMVYMTPDDLGYLPYVKSWLPILEDCLSEDFQDLFISYVESFISNGLKFIHENCTEPIKITDLTRVTSMCRLFESLFRKYMNTDHNTDNNNNNNKQQQLKNVVDIIFAYSYLWGLGSSLDEISQKKFADFVAINLQDLKPPRNAFEYYIDLNDCQWRLWSQIVPEFKFDPQKSYFQMLVPTVDTIRYSNLLDTCLNIGRSVFFTGTTGVGKSAIIYNYLKQAKDSKLKEVITLSFSAQTKARKTQINIESKMMKLRKSLIGPSAGKKMIIFVDDVNMPAVEKYGAQPPIELLRQLQDQNGFYDRKKLFWKSVKDTTLICAAAPPGGGRRELTPRFIRHFHMFTLPQPSGDTLNKIFSSIFSGFMTQVANINRNADYSSVVQPLVKSTVELYNDICNELLPTPAKSHYIFNLRDVSKVFQGILMVAPTTLNDRDCVLRLWIHECMRCFHDRLIDDIDRTWFKEKLINLLNRNLKLRWTVDEIFTDNTIMFADFLRPGLDRQYEESKDMNKLQQLLDQYLDDYNEASTTNQMNLVLFDDAIDHIVRIARILRQPRGNALLVGLGGSGRQSLTRLACFMEEALCMQLDLKRDFGYADFQEHLKKMMIEAGVGGRQVVFLFTENQITEERFLEDINQLLNSGEVPDLFASDELAKIIEDLTAIVGEMGLEQSRDTIYEVFVERVRTNLHIVLCMSPAGDSFRIRCRMFPSLINCTTIDWFSEWPAEALLDVSQRFLQNITLPNDEIRSSLAELCVHMFNDVSTSCDKFYQSHRRKVYLTPKSYLDHIHLYLQLLEKRRNELRKNHHRLTTGLKKLQETNVMVVELQATMKQLQPELAKKGLETEKLLKQVAIDQEKAAKVRVVVEKEEAIVKQQAQEVATLQAEAQYELDLALPALEAAIDALNALKKSDISEIKTMANPPQGVVMVMEAVCIMLGEKPDWASAQKVMANAQFIKLLKDYDKDHMDPRVIRKLRRDYIGKPSFTEEVMSKVSQAALSICMWVKAIVKYSEVIKVVEPKRQRVAEMNNLLEEANRNLHEKQEELKLVTDEVMELQERCEETLKEKQQLDDKSVLTRQRLQNAATLINSLSGEQDRWKNDAQKILEELELLVGDILIASGCIAYYGAFSGPYREELVQKWIDRVTKANIPLSSSFTFRKCLGDDVQIRQWNINQLPTDNVSIDSGILVFNSQRWPLLIDPQGQGKRWIKNEYKSNLLVTRFTDPGLLQKCEQGIRNGLPVLIEDIGEELDPSIDPILLRQTFNQGTRVLLRLGEKDLDYNPHFRLFMTTRLANPHYLPEVSIKVTVLNFTVTSIGLENQLLGEVVKQEAPEIEDKKNKLMLSMSKYRRELKEIEEKILRLLSESSGMILDDVDLIKALEDSQTTSKVISERVGEAQITQIEVETIREKYRSVAKRGSILFFVVADLANIDPMYQYSLSYFNRLFNMCILNSEKSDNLDIRLKNLQEYLTKTVFTNVCRGLFERHKTIFAFLITTSILRYDNKLDDTDWNYLIRGAPTQQLDEDTPQHLTDDQWRLACALDDKVHGIRNAARSNNSGEVPIISNFHKLLIAKIFAENELVDEINQFVHEMMGDQLAVTSNINLNAIYNDTDSSTPVIFVLSEGADPMSMLVRFAKEKNYDDRLNVISLGQGQGERARKLIKEGMKNGDWIMLQNCHLAKSFMSDLEKIVEDLNDNEIDPNFRLWLTSMPCSYFPISVLQTGVKVTNEPPNSIRGNLLRTYQRVIQPSSLELCNKPTAWKRLLFSLSLFHSVIQERKKFGPLGWNKRYEFNDSDLEVSMQVLCMFLNEQDIIPWDALQYVCGEINYGGRVTDEWDRRCLKSILSNFYNPAVLQNEEHCFSESGVYHLPKNDNTYESYLEYINSLPINAEPEIFGMHQNADIACQISTTRDILNTIVAIQPREISTSSGLSSDDIVLQIVLDIESSLSKPLPTNIEITGDSLQTVLIQEIDRFNRLLKCVKITLKRLQAAIRGEVVMSSELDDMYSSLINNQVPILWSKEAYPSLKPLLAWVADLNDRIEFMRNWAENGEPKAFCLSSFFFPQGFLTGTLQRYARRYKVPIDSLVFDFNVLDMYEPDEIDETPEDGVYIYGLFIDGGRWDLKRKCLANENIGEVRPKLPIIHFKPHVPDANFYNNNKYICPVYKTSVRAGVLSTTGQSTNFVVAVHLEMPVERRDQNYWILHGTALLCQEE